MGALWSTGCVDRQGCDGRGPERPGLQRAHGPLPRPWRQAWTEVVPPNPEPCSPAAPRGPTRPSRASSPPPASPRGSLTAALGPVGQCPFGRVLGVGGRVLGPPQPRGCEEAGAAAVGTALVGVGHLQGPGAGRQPPEPDQDSARPPPARAPRAASWLLPVPGCPSHPLPPHLQAPTRPNQAGRLPLILHLSSPGSPRAGVGVGTLPRAWSGPDLGPVGCSWGEAWGAPALGPGSLTSVWGSCPWGRPGTGHGSLGASGAPGPPARPGAARSAGCPSGPWTADVTSFRSAGG